MNPEEDPEARIRELERPLSEQARASELGASSVELGTGESRSGYGYVDPPGGPAAAQYPPPPPPPPPGSFPPPMPGTYHQPPPTSWGPPYPNSSSRSFGTFNPTVRTASASFRVGWLVFGMMSVIGLLIAGGVFIAWNQTASQITSQFETAFSSDPTFGTNPIGPGGTGGSDPAIVPTATAGASVSVSGADEHRSVVCDGGTVNVSGVRNQVEITGNCQLVVVSGVGNQIVVDTAAQLRASGFDNKLTYHSGTPEITNSGGNNVVQQG